jgi:RHS repeat-associated protein
VDAALPVGFLSMNEGRRMTFSVQSRFTGKERDAETQLDYFGARYYASSIGRFVSPDPSGAAFSDVSSPQSWNLYSYVRGNSPNAVDPDGRECVWENGSFDSKDDPQTGSILGCQKAGGVYYEPSTFTAGNGQDWSAAPNADLAAQHQEAMELAALQPQGPDPSSATGSSTSTSGMTTMINLWGPNWQSMQVSTGFHAWRDNNPGNMMVAGGFAGRYGAIGNDGRVAVFPSAGIGSNALDSLLHTPTYMNMTVNQALAAFAPPIENDTAAYQQFIQNVIGVNANTAVSSLSPSQFAALENGIARYEGFTASRNYSVTTTSVIMPR